MRQDIRNVVVLLAGSRTGSSFLFDALKHNGEFLASTGEETPFLRMAGIGRIERAGDSDVLRSMPSPAQLDHAAAALLADAGLSAVHGPERRDRDGFVVQIANRLSHQWPAIFGDHSSEISERLRSELVSLVQDHAFGDHPSWRRTFLGWIRELRDRGFPIHEAAYQASMNSEAEIDLCRHLPDPLHEELPYVIPEPKQMLGPSEIAGSPLLLKTSTHVYRTEMLRAMFPRARFRWIILSRNPAAVIHALMHGWWSSGFHSHRMDRVAEGLSIEGYSERSPAGKIWWKHDLPEGWEHQVNRKLSEVCSFQWQSAHEAVRKFLETPSLRRGDPVCQLRYEELADPARLSAVLGRLIDFAQTRPRSTGHWDPSEPVLSVTHPAPGKWKARASEILPLIRKEAGLSLARYFGYDPDEAEQWI